MLFVLFFASFSLLLLLLRFTEDIYQMTGYRPGTYWQLTWRYIGPAIMSCILVSSIVCLAIDNPEYNAYHAEEVKTNSLNWTCSKASPHQSLIFSTIFVLIRRQRLQLHIQAG